MVRRRGELFTLRVGLFATPWLHPRAVRPMKTEDRRACPSCGNEFSGAVEFCPVSMLHGALADDVESGESSSERVIMPKSQVAQHHLEKDVLGEEQAVDISGRDQAIRPLSPNAVPASNTAASAMPTCSGVSDAAISVMLIDNPRRVFRVA
jgi:hypothetical protein